MVDEQLQGWYETELCEKQNEGKMSFASRMKSCVTKITIEPYFLLYMYAGALMDPAANALLYKKVCLESFNSTTCDGIDSGNYSVEEKYVQTATSHWMLYGSICFYIPSIFLSFSYGNFSDHISRKITLLLPLIGQMGNAMCLLINGIHLQLPLKYMLIGHGFSGMFGGWIVCLSSSFSYISDITTLDERTLRIALLEASGTFANIFSNFMSGYILDHTNFTFVFSLACGLYALAFLYTIVFVKDPSKKTIRVGPEPKNKFSRICQLFGPKSFIDTMRVVFRKRQGYKRGHIICMLIIIVVVILLVMPSYALGYLYVRRYPLSWSQTLYGYYWGYRHIVEFIVRLGALRLLKRCCNMHETSLMILSLISTSLSEVLYGLTSITWVIFMVPLVGCFAGILGLVMRAYLSTLVDSNELGKVFAVFGSLESAAVMSASALYNTLYPLTLDTWPGMLFVVGAAIVIFPLGITIWLKINYDASRVPYSHLSPIPEEIEPFLDDAYIDDDSLLQEVASELKDVDLFDSSIESGKTIA